MPGHKFENDALGRPYCTQCGRHENMLRDHANGGYVACDPEAARKVMEAFQEWRSASS